MNRNGFTLAEMVAVIAILMILALLSTPFVKGYIDDSYNGKAQVFLRQLNEARLNFEKDYPGTTVQGDFDYEATGSCDNIDSIYGGNNIVSPAMLVRCNYIKVPTDLQGRYSFKVGSASASCGACKNSMVSMSGDNKAGIYQGKCACADDLGSFFKENMD